MKKIICMLAMALLVIGAAQAQNQVRKMVVRQNDGQVVKFKTANIEEVTFEEVAIPTTVEEAEAMLVGYWKCSLSPQEIFPELPDDIEGVYWVVTEDLESYTVFKIADSVSDEDFILYAGMYLADDYGGDLIVNSEDPTTGKLGLFFVVPIFFKNLEENCFDGYMDIDDIKLDFTCSRVEPFEYILIEDKGLLKK